MKRNPQRGRYGPEEFRDELGVSAEELERLQEFVALLTRWLKRVNLISRNSLADIWRRHILDSAQLLQYAPPTARRWADLGSGAGFPGLVTAILGAPDQHLIESDGRKYAFLVEAVRATQVEVTLHHARIEDLEPLSADVVTARALAPLTDLLPHASRHGSGRHTCLLPKGRNAAIELRDAAKSWSLTYRCFPSLSHPEGRVLAIQAAQFRQDPRKPKNVDPSGSSPSPTKKAGSAKRRLP
ncbi:MAG: 16S rRNA (guanine(527)-N(7))-methyltransferase RsmG [Proteobacteria bacterium]|nr:16S rRNA (guanine(527)-N(7))-methyltransferase RsmG [Pseudomonadota bacterium]